MRLKKAGGWDIERRNGGKDRKKRGKKRRQEGWRVGKTAEEIKEYVSERREKALKTRH